MPLSYKDTAAPIVEPVALPLAKLQLVVDAAFVLDDLLISGLIVAARQYVEKVMQRAIYNRPMNLWLDFFPFPDYSGTINANDRHCLYGTMWHALAIRLPKPRCLAVQSITYIDLNNVVQTLDPATYFVDPNSEPARIVPMPGIYWPYTQSYLPGSVCISYTAGSYDTLFTDSLTVPAVAPFTVSLSQAAALAAGTSQLTSAVSLMTAGETPAAVAFTIAAGVLTVNSSYEGQMLTASYTAGAAPQTVIQAMLLLISHWYSNRDAAMSTPPKEIDFGVRSLLAGELFDTFGF
jgi:hypothetical protein